MSQNSQRHSLIEVQKYIIAFLSSRELVVSDYRVLRIASNCRIIIAAFSERLLLV
jgi:hypothetical protein